MSDPCGATRWFENLPVILCVLAVLVNLLYAFQHWAERQRMRVVREAMEVHLTALSTLMEQLPNADPDVPPTRVM